MKQVESFAVIGAVLFTLIIMSCDNGTTSTVDNPSEELTTIEKVSNVKSVVFPTFSDPSGSTTTGSRAANIEDVDNKDDGNTDTSEAYSYIESINETFIPVLTNTFLGEIKLEIDQGGDFNGPTFIEFSVNDTDITIDIDCTLKIDTSGDRVAFYGYVDRYVDFDGDGVADTSILDSPSEMSFASDFSDIIMQLVEVDSNGDRSYEIAFFNYVENSGLFGSYEEANQYYTVEQIITDQNNSITFKLVTNETEGKDVFMYSIYQEGIKHYYENSENLQETYYRYSDGTVIDGTSLSVKSELDAKISDLISNTNSSTARTLYEAVPSADLSADKYDAIKTAHDDHFN